MPWPVEQLCRLILSIYDRMLVLDLEHLAIDGRTTRAPCGDEEAPGQAQRDAECNGERDPQMPGPVGAGGPTSPTLPAGCSAARPEAGGLSGRVWPRLPPWETLLPE